MTLHLVPTAPAPPRHGWIADPQVVPCGPVRELIRRNWPGSQMSLARFYAARFGGVDRDAARKLQRLGHQEWVSIDTADRLCVLLGANFSVLYRDRDIRTWAEVTAASRQRATLQRLANRRTRPNARRRKDGVNVLTMPATEGTA